MVDSLYTPPPRSALTMAILLLLCGSASAEGDHQASEFFRAGEASYARGDFPAAARSFEEAHRRAPHASTLYNAGLAWELGGDRPRAADDYAAAVKMGTLEARQAADATGRLGALEKSLGRLAITAPDGDLVSVGHLERAPVPLLIHLTPAAYDVTLFRRNGRSESLTTVAVAGQQVDVTFEVDLTPAPPPPLAPAELEHTASVNRDRHQTLGWTAVGTGTALGGLAIYLGLEAWQARDKYNLSQRTDRSAYDRASTLRTWTNVMWIGTVVAMGVGVTLLMTAPSKRSATASHTQARWASATLSPGGVTCAVGF
jgi:tetratricopeptide (TPR) repeat protein